MKYVVDHKTGTRLVIYSVVEKPICKCCGVPLANGAFVYFSLPERSVYCDRCVRTGNYPLKVIDYRSLSFVTNEFSPCGVRVET